MEMAKRARNNMQTINTTHYNKSESHFHRTSLAHFQTVQLKWSIVVDVLRICNICLDSILTALGDIKLNPVH